jgi:hypothetical protein
VEEEEDMTTRTMTLIDVTTVAIGGVTWLVVTRFKKIPEPLVIVAAGLAGLVLRQP